MKHIAESCNINGLVNSVCGKNTGHLHEMALWPEPKCCKECQKMFYKPPQKNDDYYEEIAIYTRDF